MKLILTLLPNSFSICWLPADAQLPDWVGHGEFFSITKTPDEISVIVESNAITEEVQCEKGWKAFKVEGPIDFSVVGILSSLAQPLADANISIFAQSTYETDYIFVKEKDAKQAMAVLSESGHTIQDHNVDK